MSVFSLPSLQRKALANFVICNQLNTLRNDRSPGTQWVKRLPTDLAFPSSSPARGEIFSTVNGIPFHTVFHYQPPIVLKLKYF